MNIENLKNYFSRHSMNQKGQAAFLGEFAAGGALLIIALVMMYVFALTQGAVGQGAGANANYNLVSGTIIGLVVVITILSIVLAAVLLFAKRGSQ